MIEDRRKHRMRVHTQTWGNVPPFKPSSLHRAECACGWQSEWFYYETNVPRVCPQPKREDSDD